jgi:hypothetical protein
MVHSKIGINSLVLTGIKQTWNPSPAEEQADGETSALGNTQAGTCI